MAILPIPEIRGTADVAGARGAPTGVDAAGKEGVAARANAVRPARPASARPPVEEHRRVEATPERDELQALASQARLELRFHRLPDSDVTLVRFIEPETGEVIREYPPENLARALKELRQLAASRLDRQA